MIVELFVLLISVLLLKLYSYKRNLLKGLEHLPQIKYDLPIIGASYRFLNKDTTQIMEALIEFCAEAPTPSVFWFGHTLTFLISKPEDMKTVLTSPNCLQKPYVYGFISEGLGLFNSDAHIWKKDRKVINLTFNNRILSSFVPIFNEKTNSLCEKLSNNVLSPQQTFNLSDYIFAATLEMICATTLGHDVGVYSEKNTKFSNALEKLSESVARRMANLILHPEFIYKFSPMYFKDKVQFDALWDLGISIRHLKQKEFFDNKSHLKSFDENDKEPQLFVNEMLKLYAKGEINESSIDEQVMTMIVGGNETSALTSANTLLMLAMHPEIQERVFNELTDVYDSQTTESTLEDIGKLDYMEMVIKETMRLLPVGPFLGRECQVATKISNCTIPVNSLIILCFYNMHRNPEIWGDNANVFDPDNFTPDKVEARHPYAYLPFSGGPRNCVGIKYAWISVKIMLSALLRNYRFTTAMKFEDLMFKWDITLKIANKHMVKIERREPFGNTRV